MSALSLNQITIRTFGDLRQHRPWLRERFNAAFNTTGLTYQSCSSCKRSQPQIPALWHYSARSYACDDCMERRKDEVLPEVRKHEAFQVKLRAIR